MSGTRAIYEVFVDWLGDHAFTGSNDDITGRTMDIEWTRGRDRASQLQGRFVSAKFVIILDNRSGDYSGFNTSGPLFGSLLPNRHVRISTRLYPEMVIRDGATAYWELDAAPADIWYDRIGSVTATMVGSVAKGVSPMRSGLSTLNKSVRFDNATCAVSIASNSFTYPFGGGGAVECWINATSTGSYSPDVPRILNHTGWFLDIADQSGSFAKITFTQIYTGTNAAWRTDDRVIRIHNSHHVVVNYNSNSTANSPVIYVDGTVAQITKILTGSGSISSSPGPIYIGNRFSGDRAFDGRVDDLAIYSSTISSAVIMKHYEVGTDELAGTIIGSGITDVINAQPQLRDVTRAEIVAVGQLRYINPTIINIEPVQTIAGGTAVRRILTRANWHTIGTDTIASRNIDDGQTTMDWFYVDHLPAINALRKVEETESGFIGESKDGSIFFQDRHHRLKSPFTTSTVVFSDSPTATLRYFDIRQDDPRQEVFNEFITTVQIFTTGTTTVLWTCPATGNISPRFGSGVEKTFWASYPNPTSTSNAAFVRSWVTPTATVDFNFNTTKDDSGTNHNGSMEFTLSKFARAMKMVIVNNSGTTVFMTKLSPRGQPVFREDPLVVSESDEDSQDTWGISTFPNPGEFIPDEDQAKDWALNNLQIYATSSPSLEVSLNGNLDSTHMKQVLQREISDRITVEATGSANLGINEDFFIEAEHHRIDNHRNHTVTWKVSKAVSFSDFFVVGVSKVGINARLTY